MTDERDPKVSAAYRGLGAEEPPRALDEAILAAARREAVARPSRLEVRAGRQRWYAPLATAAVLVLAVAVTLNMQTERPGIEFPVPQASAPPPAAVRDIAKAREKDSAAVAKEETVKREVAAPAAPPAASEPKPFLAEKPAIAGGASSDTSRNVGSSAAGALAQPFDERRLRDSQAASAAPKPAPLESLAKRSDSADTAARAESAQRAEVAPRAAAPARMQQKLADTPERELERIAEMRAQGRHEEAEKALAEFRKRNPDYVIPEAMRARVERR